MADATREREAAQWRRFRRYVERVKAAEKIIDQAGKGRVWTGRDPWPTK